MPPDTTLPAGSLYNSLGMLQKFNRMERVARVDIYRELQLRGASNAADEKSKALINSRIEQLECFHVGAEGTLGSLFLQRELLPDSGL